MDDKTKLLVERAKHYMDSEYLPNVHANAQPGPDHKVANAAEYSANHIGKISKSLASIAESLAKIAAKP